MGTPSHIKLSKYLVHEAQWQALTLDNYGGTVATTPVTVACFFLEGTTYRNTGYNRASPVDNVSLEHTLLLYSTPGVKVGDVFVNITDQDGAVLVASARATRVAAYHGIRSSQGVLMKEVTLAFN